MLRLHVKLEHPQPRHIARAAEFLRAGGLAVYPTDTTYGLGCDLYSHRSIERVYQLKGMSKKKPLAFLCSDLSEVARYAVVDDRNYRILRHHLPGRYTFVLPASRDVPKIIQQKTRTVGIRIPDSPVCLGLLAELGHPLISTTVGRATDEGSEYINDPDEIAETFRRNIDVLLDGGPLYQGPSSVVDLTGDEPRILREGSGDLSWLGAE